MKIDVYLETGVRVEVPDGAEADSELVRRKAKLALLELLDGGAFEVMVEAGPSDD